MLGSMPLVGIPVWQWKIAFEAIVRHLALVIALHVLVQIGDNFELAPARVTLVGMLPGVGQHVSIQVAFVTECLEANLALGSHSLLVYNQVVLLDGRMRVENLTALFALNLTVSFLLRLMLAGGSMCSSFMYFQSLPGAVPKRTEVTLQRTAT